MIPAIRDVHLEAVYENPRAGLEDLGLGAVELRLTPDFTLLHLESGERVECTRDEDIRAYRNHLRALEVYPCALLCDWRFDYGIESTDIDRLIQAIELASLLDAPVIRVDPMLPQEGMLPLLAHAAYVAQVTAEAIFNTSGTSVALGVENHGISSNSVTFLLQMRRVTPEPRLGLTLDPANFYWRGFPLQEVYAMVDLLAGDTVHTHVKNIAYPESERDQVRPPGWEYKEYAGGPSAGDIDYAQIVGYLRREYYEGALCIENEAFYRVTDRAERIALLRRDAALVLALAEGGLPE